GYLTPAPEDGAEVVVTYRWGTFTDDELTAMLERYGNVTRAVRPGRPLVGGITPANATLLGARRVWHPPSSRRAVVDGRLREDLMRRDVVVRPSRTGS
ncbi:MAG: hypothetical protein JXA33_01235, partial [Anaerolineae bacterium]|nr:hypothetical protein [Anaerolineae bacterium]